MKSFSDSYKAAGVDVTAGYKSVELMKEHVARTFTKGVLAGIPVQTVLERSLRSLCFLISMTRSELTVLLCV